MLAPNHLRLLGLTLTCVVFAFLALTAVALYETIRDIPEAAHKLFHVPDGSSKQLKFDRVFATYLTSPPNAHPDDADDNYFIATRMLTYQLLHAPETRLRTPIPFVVFVAESVSPQKRQRLEMDGAAVVELEHLGADWVNPTEDRWSDVMTKLRMWQREEFGLIAFIDADMVLTQPIDGLFDDPAVRECKTKKNPNSNVKGPPEPDSYVMAAITQINEGHDFPPVHVPQDLPNPWFFNAGLMVFRPGREIFKYYKWFLDQPGAFDPGLPEQGLLNWVHQELGNMLWTKLDPIWNVQYPSQNDIDHGVRMLHDKWWNTTHPEETGELFKAWRWRMEGFYEAFDRYQ
ncbi:Glycosyl transferase family 8 [Macrophomina phaseolina MS6]|uniref:Glycosyl transferase family 8 n=2 Tax=Macrophomina phaseolina TaxID=35725 RepID=K2S1Y8_MACPH|nr:Glycosyl transferase family 8 [Macrophomina phaseolina MS6]